jgi:Fe-S cluster assembly protein SufD
VYTDDVRCGHGAACGQIDDEALFYLRSRGMDETTARNFVIHGFVAEVIDSIKQDQLRDHISGLVHSKLEDWLVGSSPE